MGKDWYSTITSNNGATAKSSKKCPSSSPGGGRPTAAASGGCMNAIFQFFDFHRFQFCLHHPHSSLSLPEETHCTVLKGMEAPRNSLELETEVLVLSSSKQNEKLHFPGLQIKTSGYGDERRSTDLSSEIGSSPATKTPTLVARLMGLDLLPDSCSSPSSSSTVSSVYATPCGSARKSHLRRRQGVPGCRSLPETPRVSSSSSRRSVDADHRLSLQINKENAAEAFEVLRFTARRRSEARFHDENRSSSEYARQVLRQVKESVGKRLGLADITNCSVSKTQEQRRDQELLIRHLKFKKSAKPDTDSSPAKNKPTTSAAATKPPSSPAGRSQEKQKQAKKVSGGERFRSRLIKKPPQKSDIVRKNKHEEPISRQPSMKVAGNVIPVKKDISSPATKIVVLQTQNQVRDVDADEARGPRRSRSQLCGSLGQKYKQPHTARDAPKGGFATAGDGGALLDYVTRILNRTTYRSSPSPSNRLDPSLFHQLELSYHPSAAATTVSDRKLLFHVVDEILVGKLKPHVGLSELADTLCAKIRSFPGKECSVLGDIDEIVAGDLSEWEIRNVTRLGLSEEGERIVSDVEKELVDALVHETAVGLCRFGGN